MRARKLLILGGSGFVGHYLLPRLGEAGHTLTVLTRNRAQHRELSPVPGVHLCNGDVHDADVLARHLSGQDAVINLVGILNESGDDTFQKVHVELTEKLITACQRAGVTRLLQLSALKAGQGLSEYLKSRGRAEQRIKASQLDWTLLQSSVMFGRGDGLISRFGGLIRMTPVLPLPRPQRAWHRFMWMILPGPWCAALMSIDQPEDHGAVRAGCLVTDRDRAHDRQRHGQAPLDHRHA